MHEFYLQQLLLNNNIMNIKDAWITSDLIVCQKFCRSPGKAYMGLPTLDKTSRDESTTGSTL